MLAHTRRDRRIHAHSAGQPGVGIRQRRRGGHGSHAQLDLHPARITQGHELACALEIVMQAIDGGDVRVTYGDCVGAAAQGHTTDTISVGHAHADELLIIVLNQEIATAVAIECDVGAASPPLISGHTPTIRVVDRNEVGIECLPHSSGAGDSGIAGRRLIRIGDSDRNVLRIAVAAIRNLHADFVDVVTTRIGWTFEVWCRGKVQYAGAADCKVGRVGTADTVVQYASCVGIRGSHGGHGSHVLRDTDRRSRTAPVAVDTGRVVIDVADVDGEYLVADRTVAAACKYRDAVADRGLEIQQQTVGNRHHAGIAVNGKTSARIVGQRISDGVVGGIRIAGSGSQSNGCTVDCILRDVVGCRIIVGNRAHIKFIDIDNVECESLIRERSVRRRCPHRDVVGSGSFTVYRTRNRHHARIGADGKTSARAVGQRISNSVGGGIRIAGCGSQPDGRAIDRVLQDSVGSRIAIGNRPHIEFIDIVHVHRQHLIKRRVSKVGHPHADAVTRLGLIIGHAVECQLAAREGECSVIGVTRARNERKRELVARVGVGGCQRRHRCTGRVVLVDTAGRESDAGGGLIR